MEYVLVMYVVALVGLQGGGVALAPVPGYPSLRECQEAGQLGLALGKGLGNEARYVCLPRRSAMLSVPPFTTAPTPLTGAKP